MDVRESLIRFMREGIKDERIPSVGLEAEHFILRKSSGEAVPYAGEGGIREILSSLMEKTEGSEPLPGEELLGFLSPDYSITLEPAAQLEISINASEDLAWIKGVYEEFLRLLRSVLEPYDYTCVAAATQPVSRVRELPLIPKGRYRLMDRYFEGTGDGGVEMMRGTCSVQASIDYFSEEDFQRKIQATSFYSPMLKLLTEHALFFEGMPVEMHLKRTDIWNRTDPGRCGVLPGIFREDYSFSDYADFLLQMPLIFQETKEGLIYTGEKTTAELYEGKEPLRDELLHIQSMAFPDVRVKQYLEIRSADAVPPDRAIAYGALIKGLLYSEEGLDYALTRVREKDLSEQDIRAAEKNLMQRGWDSDVYGEAPERLAESMLEIARRHLPAAERELLEPLFAVVRESSMSSGGKG